MKIRHILFILLVLLATLFLICQAEAILIIQTEEAAGSWSDVWVATTVTGDSTWSDYNGSARNYRVYIFASDLTGGGSKVKITLKGHSSHTSEVQSVYIGPKKASSDPYDFDDTPTEVTFSGGSGASWSGGTSVTSDEITYDLDDTKDHIVAIYYDGADDSGYMGYLDYGGTNDAAYKNGTGDESGTTNVSGYSATQYLEYLEKIEGYE